LLLFQPEYSLIRNGTERGERERVSEIVVIGLHKICNTFQSIGRTGITGKGLIVLRDGNDDDGK